MKLKSILFVAAGLFCSAVAAQTTPTVPANVLADRLAVRAALEKFAADRAAVPLDKVLLRSDFVALRDAVVTLVKSPRAQLTAEQVAILAGDKAAIVSAVAQMKADRQNGGVVGVPADRTALKAAITQLRTDVRAILPPARPPGGP